MVPATTDFEYENFSIKLLYTGCLAEACYIITSGNEMAVIDPLRYILQANKNFRDTSNYIDLAEQRKCQIKYICMTHFHADFVSGHIEMKEKTGGQILYGPNAEANFDFKLLVDGERLPLGKIEIEIIHTPGHTMESTTYMIRDQGKVHSIFTGDTLFLGEVGRPDLAVKSGSITKEDLAGYLYESLFNKICKLPDETLVFPGHGAGSPCGKAISAGTHDTLGNQKMTNYALQLHDKNDFIASLTSNLPQPPAYFFHDVASNKGVNYKRLEDVVKKSMVPIKPQDIQKFLDKDSFLIDCRNCYKFLQGFIPGSLLVDLEGSFALWVGKLVTPDHKFVIISEAGHEEEAIIRLARIGYDNVLGYVEGGIEAYQKAGNLIDQANLIESADFVKLFNENKNVQICDIRNPRELTTDGFVENCVNMQLDQLEENVEKLGFNKDVMTYVYCKGGQRASCGVSILKKHGFQKVTNIKGGIMALKASGLNCQN